MVFVATVSRLRTEQPPATNTSTAKHKTLRIRNPKSAGSSSEFKITVRRLDRKSKRGQAHNESRALAFRSDKGDALAVKVDTAFDNRKPQAGPGNVANVRARVEGSEQIGSIGCGDADFEAFISSRMNPTSARSQSRGKSNCGLRKAVVINDSWTTQF